MLIALTALSNNWWGFMNVVVMVLSVVVREVLVWQHRDAIEEGIDQSWDRAEKDYERKMRMYGVMMTDYEKKMEEYERVVRDESPAALPQLAEPKRPLEPQHPATVGKVIVIMDDAKVVTIKAPEYMIVRTLVQNPNLLNPKMYIFFRQVGWVAFAAHIITLGMAALHTQIYSVLLLIIATFLTVSKVGCEDWKIRDRVDNKAGAAVTEGSMSYPCWISSRLQIRCSKYPEDWAEWKILAKLEGKSEKCEAIVTPAPEENPGITKRPRPGKPDADIESAMQEVEEHKKYVTEPNLGGQKIKKASKPSGRRQDLYVWLKPTDDEEETMKVWDLLPRNDEYWMAEFRAKKEEHESRLKIGKMAT